MIDPVTNLVLAAVFFVGIHLFVAGTRLRDTLTGAIGERGYLGLFSVLSLVGIVWLAMAYNTASAETYQGLWVAQPWWRHAAMTVILLAAFLVVLGLTTPSPTSVGQDELLEHPQDAVKGIQRITRHPFLWGVLLWALAHIAMNGDVNSVIFFGSFALLGLFGPMSIDAKKARLMGDKWAAYARATSRVPFLAILGGRNSLKLGEIGLWRPLAALAVYFALAYGHPWLFGVAALPT